jgi:phospholipid transport system transporter-binding protein
VNPDDRERHRARVQRHDTRSFGVSGAMTFDSVNALWRDSDEMFSGDGVVQIDLREVTHTDSAGLALLVEWLREAGRRGGRVEFLNLPAQMIALADAANLQPVLTGNRGDART